MASEKNGKIVTGLENGVVNGVGRALPAIRDDPSDRPLTERSTGSPIAALPRTDILNRSLRDSSMAAALRGMPPRKNPRNPPLYQP